MSDIEKPKYIEKNPLQCYFVNHKPHMVRPGTEPRPLQEQVSDSLPKPFHDLETV